MNIRCPVELKSPALTAPPLPPSRIRSRLGTVEDLWLNSETLKFESDGDISDVSEIWSEYGDVVEPPVQPKLNRWNPLKKTVSERIHKKRDRQGKKNKKRYELLLPSRSR